MMTPRIALLALVICPLQLPAEEETTSKVYKTTDEHGRPVFSDQGGDGAQEVKVNEPMTFPAGSFAERYNRFTAPAGDEVQPFNYSSLVITSPSTDEAIRDNAGNLTISFSIEPGLQPGHNLQLMMDGQVLQQIRSAEPISLENIDRGTHQLQLQVIDAESGDIVQEGAAVSFTLLRHSILLNQAR